jgi:hypothetical protein
MKRREKKSRCKVQSWFGGPVSKKFCRFIGGGALQPATTLSWANVDDANAWAGRVHISPSARRWDGMGRRPGHTHQPRHAGQFLRRLFLGHVLLAHAAAAVFCGPEPPAVLRAPTVTWPICSLWFAILPVTAPSESGRHARLALGLDVDLGQLCYIS